MRRAFPVLLAATLALALATIASAMSVLPLDLTHLTAEAGTIFVGRVERVDAGRDAGGLPAVWTTFSVDQTLKGAAAGHLTMKQLGATFGGADAAIAPRTGLPRYAPGESVVLFLHPASALGFTSPVGLGQGCFRIRERDGERVVENDVGNRNLGTDGKAANARAGSTAIAAPPSLDAFLGRVRALVAAAP